MPAKNKAIASFTLSPDVMEMINELADITGWTKTRCVEECVRYAYPELKKRLMALKTKREEEEEKRDEHEKLREEYWRRLYLGQIRQEDWESAWWSV
jgi:hypothetical protein